jgi:hypothetical protein
VKRNVRGVDVMGTGVTVELKEVLKTYTMIN